MLLFYIINKGNSYKSCIVYTLGVYKISAYEKLIKCAFLLALDKLALIIIIIKERVKYL